MKTRYLSFAFFLVPFMGNAQSQSFEDVLRSIMANSTMMHAESAYTAAEIAGHNSELTLENPEVSFNYLWGAPTDVGSRKDVSVSQKLNAAFILGVKKKVARAKENVSLGEFDVRRLSYALEATQVLLKVVYLNRLVELNGTRLTNTRELYDKYVKMLVAGETNKIDVGKAKLELVNVETDYQTSLLDRQMMCHKLKAMNGGKDVKFTSTDYPSSFSLSVAGNDLGNMNVRSAVSNLADQKVVAAKREISLAKASNAPELSVGYMAELTREEKFRGVTLGLSVPLWRNGRNVRMARAHEMAVREQVEDDRLKLDMKIEELRLKVSRLLTIYDGQQKALSSVQNLSLLRKALDAGEISLLDYIIEQNQYYELYARLLSVECDYYCALAELQYAE